LKWRAILFDFDYTLADSSPGIIACANYALTRLGLPQAEAERIRATIGLPLENTFEALTSLADPLLQADFKRCFIQHADEIMVDSTTLYESARQVIPLLVQRGFLLGIVSTKYLSRLEGVLHRENMRQSVAVLVGGDTITRQKPAPEGLLLAADLLGLPATDCIYVGDSPVDAQAACHAGMDFIALLTGPAAADAFSQERLLALLPGLAELPGWLQAYGESPEVRDG
jgi:phosphoglycolate phosphatase